MRRFRVAILVGVVACVVGALLWRRATPIRNDQTRGPSDLHAARRTAPETEGDAAEGLDFDRDADDHLVVHVTDAMGDGVSDALVYLLPFDVEGLERLNDGTPHDSTGPDGTVIMETTAGAFSLVVKCDGFRTAFRIVQVPDVGRGREHHVWLDRGTRIAGRVLLPEGTMGTVSRSIVYEAVKKPARTWRYPGRETAEWIDGRSFYGKEDGRFAIEGLRPGRYSLEVRGPGTLWERLEVVAPSEGLLVELERSATVVVRVPKWQQSDETILRANLYREGTREVISGVAARKLAKGEVTIRDYVPPGRYDLEVEVEDDSGLEIGRGRVVVKKPGELISIAIPVKAAPRLSIEFADKSPMDGFVLVYQGTLVRAIARVRGRQRDVAWRPGCDGVQYVGKDRITPRVELHATPWGAEHAAISLDPYPATRLTVGSEEAVFIYFTDLEDRRRKFSVIRQERIWSIGESATMKEGDVAILLQQVESVQLHAHSRGPTRTEAVFELIPKKAHVLAFTQGRYQTLTVPENKPVRQLR